MEIKYSQHAVHQQKERQIDENRIRETIETPDRVFGSRFDTQIAQKVFDGRLLRVVYKKEDNQCVVITAYYTHVNRYGGE